MTRRREKKEIWRPLEQFKSRLRTTRGAVQGNIIELPRDVLYNETRFNARDTKLSLLINAMSGTLNGNECFSSGPALSTNGRVVLSAFSFEDRSTGGGVGERAGYQVTMKAVVLFGRNALAIFRCVRRPDFRPD